MLMGRTNIVASSPHRAEYEKMRFEDRKSIKEIWIYAKEKYGEDVGYYSFQRFFKSHDRLMSEMKKASKLRARVLEEEIRKDIKIAQELTKNLDICREKIEDYSQREHLDQVETRALLGFLGETRLIIEELLKWSSKIKIQPKTEDIFNRILYCMSDFSKEDIEKFQERWIEYES